MGFGYAGAVAALEAREAGADVLLVEKMPDPGGISITSGGNVRIVADAEKAFVSMLRPEYNVTTFANYPEGRDGLFSSDLVRYAYVIGEDLEFATAHGRIRGRRDPYGFPSNESDFLFVNGDEVSLLVSGIDFP